MYKKITHSIVEEHFDTSADINFKKLIDTNLNSRKPRQAESEELTKLHMDSRDYFSDYYWRLRLYLVSLMASTEDLPALESYIFKNIDGLGKIIEPYYGIDAATELTKLMSEFAQSIINIFKATKAGSDISVPRLAAYAVADKIANFLNSLNPVSWWFTSLQSSLGSSLYNWIEQATYRKNKEWDKDINSADYGYRVLVSGTRAGAPSFSDIFTRGIIQ